MDYKILKIHPKATLVRKEDIVEVSQLKEETETKLNLLSEGYVNFSDFTKQHSTLEETNFFIISGLEKSIEKIDYTLFSLKEKYRRILGEIK